MDGLARVRQAEGEQVAGHQLAGETDRHVAEVDFRLVPGLVGLRDERLQRGLAGLDQDPRLPGGNVVADHPVGDVRPVLVDQAVKDTGDGVPLLARSIQIPAEDAVNHRLVRVQSSRPGRQLLPRLRPCRIQRLANRPPRHAVLALELPHRHAAAMVTPDRRVQLDLRHLRHDQRLSPGAPRCCPGKRPGASQTHQHPPSLERGASQTHRQATSLLLDKARVSAVSVADGCGGVGHDSEGGVAVGAVAVGGHLHDHAQDASSVRRCSAVLLRGSKTPIPKELSRGCCCITSAESAICRRATRYAVPVRIGRASWPSASGRLKGKGKGAAGRGGAGAVSGAVVSKSGTTAAGPGPGRPVQAVLVQYGGVERLPAGAVLWKTALSSSTPGRWIARLCATCSGRIGAMRAQARRPYTHVASMPSPVSRPHTRRSISSRTGPATATPCSSPRPGSHLARPPAASPTGAAQRVR
ncbi:hypothetical protein SUDANB15_00109 [Streptomyces sp. enrichment culture]